jgi:ribonuclease D
MRARSRSAGEAGSIPVITDTEALAAFCHRAQEAPYVTIDTEFMRERSYYSKLCLLQLAIPGDGVDSAVLVDPIEGDLDLAPLYALFRDESTVKVFHAARQDLEIFYVDAGVIPTPLFDTQVAAMVCGFGEQVGYETLVKRIAKANLDKSSRFTDWSRRPLSEAQKAYALADVTHLRDIYEHLSARLAETGRDRWVAEEIAALTAPETYEAHPEDAWKRIRTRNDQPRFLAIVRELARFREAYAQARDIPRNRVYKDDALLELASTKPRDMSELSRARLLLREARKGDIAEGILAAVQAGLECPEEDLPRVDRARDRGQPNPALADLLRVLLKAKTESAGVASKLIAQAADLDAIAAGERDLPALAGWRREVFGEDALRLCEGRIALAAKGRNVEVIPLD